MSMKAAKQEFLTSMLWNCAWSLLERGEILHHVHRCPKYYSTGDACFLIILVRNIATADAITVDGLNIKR